MENKGNNGNLDNCLKEGKRNAIANKRVSELTKNEVRFLNLAIMSGKAGIDKRLNTVVIFNAL